MCAIAVAAEGHAPPEANGIAWQEEGAASRVVVRTNRGLIVSEDGGSTFRLLCNEAAAVPVTEAPSMILAPDGRVWLATSGEGLLVGSADLCTWTGAEGPMSGLPAIDLARDPSNPDTMYLVTASQDTQENFWVSRDSGAGWSALAPSDVPYTGVIVAPSDPARIYRTGVASGAAGELIHLVSVSSDGGQTWQDNPVAISADELQLLLRGVDPTNADRVYARAQAASAELPERLLVSDDGGQTFSAALSGFDLKGFASSADGSTVWVGGADGLWRSSDRGQSFELVPGAGIRRVTCLEHHLDRLYACAEADNELGVSVSADGGNSFEPFLRFSEVTEPVECAPSTQGDSLCQAPFRDWQSEVLSAGVIDAGAAPPPREASPGLEAGASVDSGPSAGVDAAAGLQSDAGAGDSGCACRLAALRRERGSGVPWSLVALAVWLGRRAGRRA